MSLQIREISPADRVAMGELVVAAFSRPPWNESWSCESALQMIDEWIPAPGFYGLVAEIKEQIVGFVFGRSESYDTKQTFYLKELCVHPDFQKDGIGTELVRELESKLLVRKVASIYLLTLRDSIPSGFYGKLGYKSSERMSVFGKRLG